MPNEVLTTTLFVPPSRPKALACPGLVARLRARDQLTELHAADLRFSPAEAGASGLH
jgi:ATP/maltotriose-dependent transcriptional regulator MalT